MTKKDLQVLPGFIVFEGLDGSGKDTQAELLADFLTKQGKMTCITSEPTRESGVLSKTIRGILKYQPDFDGRNLQTLFVADRILHMEDVKKMIAKDWAVVCVRYLYSTIVYGQDATVSEKFLKELNSQLPRPELAIYLDIPAEIALERAKARSVHLERFETEEHLRTTRDNFLRLAKECPEMKVVNANQDIASIHADVIRVVLENTQLAAPGQAVDRAGICL